ASPPLPPSPLSSVGLSLLGSDEAGAEADADAAGDSFAADSPSSPLQAESAKPMTAREAAETTRRLCTVSSLI
ncbi:hypothetical protein, partial [Streptomyces griseus]|uniref:hypothetical protein n=1 Tax=Streptomyces griseus TaxID=1911 RepID=UPI0034066273